MSKVKEHSTLSNFEDVRLTHAKFDFDVDFDSKTISGTVEWRAVAAKDGVDRVVFDSQGLTIRDASVDGQAAEVSGTEANGGALGAPVTVAFPPGAALGRGDAARVSVSFRTSPEASALQWLSPEQTAGGAHPYLFSQCQAIHARSLVPCHDTPGAKFTYEASVRVPAGLTALMSALSVGEEPSEGAGGGGDVPAPGGPRGRASFAFAQSVPIPSYLLALAVGDLERRELGPRSAVWSEPSVVDAAAAEFLDTPAFLGAAESLAGPYPWGRYDLLLLPPSFPYGGMENPCLTFVTPTLLAGDRSLAGVVAHEIAHSWTGNLVTNASWEHFWLNEGWTVWLERKIAGRLRGERTYQFLAGQGAVELRESVKSWGETHPFTCLVPDLGGGVDPDEAFSTIPYEKGFYFLHYLSTLVDPPPEAAGEAQAAGGAEGADGARAEPATPRALTPFEAFFAKYVQTFALGTVDSERFKALFLATFPVAEHPRVAEVDWDAWLRAPGLPPAVNAYDETLAQQAYGLAERWHTSDVLGIAGEAAPGGVPPGPPGASVDDVRGWPSAQVVAFLDKLAELRALTPLSPATARALSRVYELGSTRNAEIRAALYRLRIAAGDETVLQPALEFLVSQGRMKYLRPIYRALYRSPFGRDAAKETFAKHRGGYHPIASKMISQDLAV